METSSHSTFAWPNALSTAAQGFSTALSLHNAIPYGKRQGEQFSDPGKEYRLAVSFRDFAPKRLRLPSDSCWRYVVDAFPKSIFVSHEPLNVIDEQKFVGLGGQVYLSIFDPFPNLVQCYLNTLDHFVDSLLEIAWTMLGLLCPTENETLLLQL